MLDRTTHPPSHRPIQTATRPVSLFGVGCVACFLFFVWMGFSFSGFCSPLPRTTNARSEIRPDAHTKVIPLGLRVEVLPDPSGHLTIHDIQRPSFATRFQPSAQTILSFGQTKTAYWLRFRIHQTSDTPETWYLATPRWWLHLSLYTPTGHGKMNEWKRRYDRPFHKRLFPYYGFVFPIELSPIKTPIPSASSFSPTKNPSPSTSPTKNAHASRQDQPIFRTFYLRAQTDFGSMSIPLDLWQPLHFQTHILLVYILWGLFFGALLSLLFYNLFLFFSLRERSYLDYVIYIGGLALYIASNNGLAFQYLWPHATWWNQRAALFFVGILLFGALRFIAGFLKTKEHIPRHHRMLRSLIVASFLLVALSLFGAGLANQFSTWLVLFTTVIAMGAIVRCAYKRHRGAYFVLGGWGALLGGGSLYACAIMGLLPFTPITQNALLIGAILEALLLSFALADRVNALNQTLDAQKHQLSEQNNTLVRLDQLKDELIANTSHELRTPLNGMIGLTEALLEDFADSLPSEAKEDLQLIAQSSRRLATLVNDLLDFSSLKQQHLTLQTTAVDLAQTVDIVIALSQKEARKKHISLHNHLPLNMPNVSADPHRLQQILHNLLHNAIKFTEHGQVTISAQIQGDFLAVSIEDTGIGIKEQDQARIFRSFEQVDGSHKRPHEGLGLGLAITKQLVTLHGGEISVHSTFGRGTRFTFTLPLAQTTNSPPTQTQTTKPPSTPSPRSNEGNDTTNPPPLTHKPRTSTNDTPTHRITDATTTLTSPAVRLLAVDDDPINLRVLQNQLRPPEYLLTLAQSGQQALQEIEQNGPFDIVLLDLMMPHMSGYEVAQKLRQHHPPHQLPILMLTAKNQVKDFVEAFQSGANDYIAKPYTKPELIARIQRQLTSSLAPSPPTYTAPSKD